MTANQINYWKLQEDKRHNATTEVELKRHNLNTEQVGYLQAQASARQAQAASSQAATAAMNASTNRYVAEAQKAYQEAQTSLAQTKWITEEPYIEAKTGFENARASTEGSRKSNLDITNAKEATDPRVNTFQVNDKTYYTVNMDYIKEQREIEKWKRVIHDASSIVGGFFGGVGNVISGLTGK